MDAIPGWDFSPAFVEDKPLHGPKEQFVDEYSSDGTDMESYRSAKAALKQRFGGEPEKTLLQSLFGPKSIRSVVVEFGLDYDVAHMAAFEAHDEITLSR